MQGAVFRRKVKLLEAAMNSRGYDSIPSDLCYWITFLCKALPRVVKKLMQLPDGNISAAHLSVLYSRLIRQHA